MNKPNNNNDLQMGQNGPKITSDWLERGSEPFWMQDIRAAQRRIEEARKTRELLRAVQSRSD